MRRNLILVAETYPFSGAAENTFIDPEIRHLTAVFDEVIVAPERVDGSGSLTEAGAVVDRSLAEALCQPRSVLFARGCLNVDFLSELLLRPWLLLHWVALWRLALFTARAHIAGEWLQKLLVRRRLRADETVIYTFWLFHSAHGFAALKTSIPDLRVVSRAHGADLYESRHMPAYIPFRARTMAWVDAVYPDSDAGTTYLKAAWPAAAGRIATARLGTEAPAWRTEASADGRLRIVSCSSLTQVKRVNLIVESLAELVRRRPDTIVEWNHFGDGPLAEDVRSQAQRLPAGQVIWRLHGRVPVSAVMAWYRDHPVDAFVNVSSSEGTPVSIMEAASCGIPIVATSVGGNREIVDGSNGVALTAEPLPAEIAAAIEAVAGLPVLREGSYALWRRRYAADTNFSAFARILCDDGAEHSAGEPS
jgi:colanic acid/amylovoran biosynthesis glycosyltransferase